MRAVYLAATLSKDPRTRIGAVLVKDNNIISTGYNNFPRGVRDLEKRYNDKETKYNFICHGEFNAILNAARSGVSTLDSTLYTQGIPCCECCKAVIQAGIKKIMVHKQWPDLVHSEKWVKSNKISATMIKETETELAVLNKELGIEGFLDGQIIKV